MTDFNIKDGDINALQLLLQQKGCELWLLRDFVIKSGHLCSLQHLLHTGCKLGGEHELKLAAKYGHVHIMKYLHEVCKLELRECIVYEAAENGQLDCLRYAVESCEANKIQISSNQNQAETNPAFAAASNGHFDCMFYLHEHNISWLRKKFSLFCDFSKPIARYGRLDLLQEMVEHGCNITSFMTLEAMKQNEPHTRLKMLHFACDHNIEFHHQCARIAAEIGDIECLQFLIEHGAYHHCEIVKVAAKRNHLECLRFATKFCKDQEHFTPNDFLKYAKKGQLDILFYLAQRGAFIETDPIKATITSCKKLHWISTNPTRRNDALRSIMLHHRHDDLITFFRDCQNPEMTVLIDLYDQKIREQTQFAYPNTMEAAKAGDLEVLKQMHQQMYVWHQDTVLYAAGQGQFECMKFAIENDCPYSSNALSWACCGAHLDCIKYLHEKLHMQFHRNQLFNVIQIDSVKCLHYMLSKDGLYAAVAQNFNNYAATNGSLNTLKYLHKNGYKWNAETSNAAASHGQLHCLFYMIEHGCEYNLEQEVHNLYYSTYIDKKLNEQQMQVAFDLLYHSNVRNQFIRQYQQLHVFNNRKRLRTDFFALMNKIEKTIEQEQKEITFYLDNKVSKDVITYDLFPYLYT